MRLALCLAALWPLSANAVLIDVNGQQWDVQTTMTSVLHGAEELLKSQPWWGDSALAFQFADAVRGQLGVGDSPPLISDCGCWGAIFAYEAVGLAADDPIAIPHPSFPDAFPNVAVLNSRTMNAWASFHIRSTGEFVEVRAFEQPTWAQGIHAVATPVSVPEPGTLLLLSSALAGLAFARRRISSR